jgi:hypothetical protein
MKSPILKNKYFLYAVLALALINVLGYLSAKRFDCIAVFVVTGLLCTYFSKNMTVNLLIAIIVTAALCTRNDLLEGMHHDDEEEEEEDEEEDVVEGNENAEESACWLEDKLNKEHDSEKSCKEAKGCWGLQGSCKQQGMSVADGAAKVNGGDDDDDYSPGKRIDYATTVEQAYDNLNKMLGPDGLKGLSKETKNLVSQQQSLMKSLEGMGPIMKTAKETMSQMPNMQELQGMIKQMGAAQQKK